MGVAYRIPVRWERSRKMMKYENGTLMLEIPAYTLEFDTIELSVMLTYIARRNPEIIKQMEIQDLPMEAVLQKYYKIVSREGLRLWERKCLDVYKRQAEDNFPFFRTGATGRSKER